jgi:hypothetical protein
MSESVLRLHRIQWPENRADFIDAWNWAREQPELYSEVVGYDDFSEFTHHPGEQIDFALRQDGELIAFASLVLRPHKSCEFELITPARPRVRSILALLRELQREFFETLGFVLLYVNYSDDPRYDRPRRLCRMFGWREHPKNHFEFSYLDHQAAQAGRLL